MLPNNWFIKLTKIQKLTLMKDTGKMHVDDVVSKRRIWQQILKKSIDDLKKVREWLHTVNLQNQIKTQKYSI